MKTLLTCFVVALTLMTSACAKKSGNSGEPAEAATPRAPKNPIALWSLAPNDQWSIDLSKGNLNGTVFAAEVRQASQVLCSCTMDMRGTEDSGIYHSSCAQVGAVGSLNCSFLNTAPSGNGTYYRESGILNFCVVEGSCFEYH